MAPILTDQLAFALGAHAACLRVLRLSLATFRLSTAGLMGLAACPLEELQLETEEHPWREGGLLEDDWPVFLPQLTRLRRLNVSGVSSFGDGGLAALGSTVGPRLTHLDVADTAVSAAGIRTIIVAPDADGCSSFARLTHLRFGWHEETRRRVARSWSEARMSLLSALLRSLARSLVALVGQGEFDRDGDDDAISVVPDCPHLRTIDLACESMSLDWDAPCAHVLDVDSSYSLLAFVRSAPPNVRHLRVLKLNQAENTIVTVLAEKCPDLRELRLDNADEVRWTCGCWQVAGVMWRARVTPRHFAPPPHPLKLPVPKPHCSPMQTR
jgi:hypothetical protein